MIDTKDILKMSRHVFNRGRGIGDISLVHPTRDWLIGIGIFVVVCTIGILVSSYWFLRFDTIHVVDTSSDFEIPKYDYIRIEYVLEKYRNKNHVFKTFQTTQGNVAGNAGDVNSQTQ